MKIVVEIDYGRVLILEATPAMMHAIEQVFGGAVYQHSYRADAYSPVDRPVRISIQQNVRILDAGEVTRLEEAYERREKEAELAAA